MKKYYRVMLISFIILTIIFNLTPIYASLPLTGKMIILDAGHGGVDPGTLHGNILEKDINLSIVLELEKELSKLGAIVILTRDGDYDLSKPNATWRKRSDFDNRIKLINESNADIYLSIHLNYLNDTSYSGPQIFYLENNKILASIIQEELNKELNTKREIQNIPENTYMYPKLEIDGVLIECGFLSNYNERQNLSNSEYQKELAVIIANSLINYF